MTTRPKARTFEDLVVWQKAHQWVLSIYRYSRGFPKSEVYGITSQLRRAAVSVPANIAEGFKKRGKRDKARLLNIAQGSLEESRYYLTLSTDLDYGPCHSQQSALDEISRMLESYLKAIRKDLSSGS